MASPFQHDLVTDIMTVRAAAKVNGRVEVPGSKSLTNRYLLLAGMAEGQSELKNPLTSEDTYYMRKALNSVGVTVEDLGEATWIVRGRQTWHQPKKPLFIGNAGTAMRFLAPSLAVRDFESEIGGNARMAARPIEDLADGLIQLHAQVTYLGKSGYPPLRIRGPLSGHEIAIRGDSSSQYLSGLLMALPQISPTPVIHLVSELVSRTYVEMTLDCLQQFGVVWDVIGQFEGFKLSSQAALKPIAIAIEPDASTASYWFGLPLIVGGRITVAGVPKFSHQGDFGLLQILAEMGAGITYIDDEVTVDASKPLCGIDVDMNSMSDVAPTLAAIATMATSATTIRNVGNMRIKECDRIQTLQDAFDVLGLRMVSGPDWMRIYPGRPSYGALLDPQEDHRMAMVFALLGMANGGLRIRDAKCVAKTYPRFWEDMSAIYGAPVEVA